MIEIRVTHPVDEAKRKKFGISAFLRLRLICPLHAALFPGGLCDAIVNQTANKKWLFNAKSEEWKQVLLRSGEKLGTIERGFATRIDYCPLDVWKWKGKSYANFTYDCSYCEFLLDVGDNNDFIICGGEHKIRTFDEFGTFRQRSGNKLPHSKLPPERAGFSRGY